MSDFFNKAKRIVFEDGQSLKVGSQTEINRIPRGRGKPDWWVVEDDDGRQEPKQPSKSAFGKAKPNQPKQPKPEGLQVVFEDGRTKPIASEAETRDIPRGKGHPDWWVTRRPAESQTPSRTRQSKPTPRRDGTLLSQGGAGMKTRGMKVPIGGPMSGPVGVAWDLLNLVKTGVDKYGRVMTEGEKRLMKHLNEYREIYNRQHAECLEHCNINKEADPQCRQDCNNSFERESNSTHDTMQEGSDWFAKRLFTDPEEDWKIK